MKKINEIIGDAKTIGIAGHIRPDGDCVGSCMALYNYLKKNRPDLTVQVYLESVDDKFKIIKNTHDISTEGYDGTVYDLFISLDTASLDRLGQNQGFFDNAKRTACIDHHKSNPAYGDYNYILPDASSASEVLFEQLNPDNVDKNVAECLYTGIVHDTGVFKYSCTSAKTMEIAGFLMGKGVDFGSIIDNSFYKKTYVQNQIMGRALLESITFLDGKAIFSALRQSDLDFYGVTGKDLDGIIDQLRLTEGVEVAIFLYETGPQQYKVSLRSQKIVDVSQVAFYFGGGGHVRAAGCTMSGSIHDVINNLSLHIAKQLDAAAAGEV